MNKAHVQPCGIAGTYPSFSRYSDDRPGRHNELVWPVVQGFWADAAAACGDVSRFESEVLALARLATASGQFAEIYHARAGAVDGGWQTVSGGFPPSRWESEPDQTWSATAYLRMIHCGLLGMRLSLAGLRLSPTLPPGFGDVTLSGVGYRGARLTIALHGAGNVIGACRIDGAPAEPVIPASLMGAHTVDITVS